MGCIFQCLEPALTIAAALAHRDPFVLPLNRKEEADAAKRSFSGDSCRLLIFVSFWCTPNFCFGIVYTGIFAWWFTDNIDISWDFLIYFYSDHIALLKAYKGWKDAKRNHREKAFCWDFFLSPMTLQMMDDMRKQFCDLLTDIGFVNKSRGLDVSKSFETKQNRKLKCSKGIMLKNIAQLVAYFMCGFAGLQPLW